MAARPDAEERGQEAGGRRQEAGLGGRIEDRRDKIKEARGRDRR